MNKSNKKVFNSKRVVYILRKANLLEFKSKKLFIYRFNNLTLLIKSSIINVSSIKEFKKLTYLK